ncbi:hypothetical protein GG681_12390 [Epibacterium sp. SM1969]|uniref:Uncharacterized protein n=1 Tax=Tritonibacter aquimaris TaxID=2663379 RepID=A0A844AZM0_9RHOB|nr:hypothetical protein [Tritonibacter aquimaris]MQY43442.1 hypothetical protein [Tritonibacter aquimaris]
MNFSYQFTDQELAWLQALSTLAAFVALLLSVVAVYFSARTYWQKKGAFIRGNYRLTSGSIATEDKYVNEVILENLKDRAVVVFAIYLKLSPNFTIKLESFEDDPTIIKPFEVIKRTYDPVDFYSFNMKKFDLNGLIDDRYQKNRLMLSTSDGRLVVKRPIPLWNPVHAWFSNYMNVTFEARRALFDGRGFGGNVLYLVNLYDGTEKKQVLPLYPGEAKFKWYRDLGGTNESLEAAEKVKAVFEDAILRDGLQFDRVEVIDVQAKKESSNFLPTGERKVAKRHSWLYVNIVGRLATKLDKRRLRKRNRVTAKAK